MKSICLVLLLFISFVCLTISSAQVEEYYKPKTPELKKELVEGIKTQGRWFVLFYREFEADSERAVLVLDEVLQKKNDQGIDFGVLRADCRVDTDGLCEGVPPTAIPLLLFFHNGERYVYTGEWNAESIFKYAREGQYEGQEQYVDPSGESIFTLNAKNFDKETSKGEWLIQVYAPWCRYCKELSPVWEALGEKLLTSNVKLGKIDGTIESGLADRLEVRGFPTIYYVKDGQKREFSGKRDLASLLAFSLVSYKEVNPKPILKAQGSEDEEEDSDLPSAVIDLTDENFLEKTKEGVWLVDFFAPWCGHCKKLVPTWERLAHKAAGDFHVAKVDATQNEGLAQAFGIRGFPTIILLKGGKQYKFSGQRTTDAFLEFVHTQHQDSEPSEIPRTFSVSSEHQEL